MPEASETRTVLIIEDEESVRSAIEAGLEVIGGYEVHSASDAVEGYSLLKELQPDILLLDLVMPVTDGMEFLRMLGSDPDTAKPGKVVLMTAMTNPVPQGGMKALGLDLILEKPFRLHQLADAVGAESPF